jgi:lipopolysaccharide export system permease protein
LLAGVISLGILAHSHELTALKAGGIPLRLIIRPIVIGSVIFTLLFVVAAQFLLPITIGKTNTIWYEQLKGKVPLGILRNNRYYYRGNDGFYSFTWPNSKTTTFKDFSYSRWNKKYNIDSLITAGTASWNKENNHWILENIQIQQSQEAGHDKITNYPTDEFQFPEKPEDFLTPENKTAELSLTGLYQEIGRSQVEHEVQAAWTAFLGRISYILLGIPLLLLGLPILLYSYQRWGRDLSVAIPASCGLAFFAWGIWGALQSLATAGYVSPFIAAASIHIIFSIVGIILLMREDR